MKKILSISLLSLLSLIMTAPAAETEWLSFNKGLAKAQKENKAIVVDFYTNWCHWCKVMDEKTFKNKDVALKLGQRFVAVRLNAEDNDAKVTFQNQTLTNVELTRAFGVTGYPTLAFLDRNGKPIGTIPGYVPADQFLQMLNYIDSKCYEKGVSLQNYLDNGGCVEKK
jgi:thioredoxin-related protein